MSGKTIDLFVSYATRDARELAEDIVADLESRGVTCWIAPRDIPAGARSWAAEIVASIRNCGSFLLLLSSGANASEEIEKEIDEAARQRKTLFAIRVEDIEPSAGLGYHLNRVQWRDLFRNRELVLEEITARVVALREVGASEPAPPTRFQPARTDISSKQKKVGSFRLDYVLLGGVAVIAIAGGAWFWMNPRPDIRTASSIPPTSVAPAPAPLSASAPISAPVPAPTAQPSATTPIAAPQQQTEPPPSPITSVAQTTPVAPQTVAPPPVTTPVPERIAPAAPSPNPSATFDGRWQVTVTCKAAGDGAAGYIQQFSAEVKDHLLRGQYNTPGTSPSATMTGRIEANGAALLNVNGLTGAPTYSVGQVRSGSPFKYTVRAKFAGDRGAGVRVELRPCAVEFARQS